MSYIGELEMSVSAAAAYKALRYMMTDLDASIRDENPDQYELMAKSAPSIWTYGFNFDCKIDAITETTSRLTVKTTMRKWTLIDTQSKRYTKRLLKVMEAYIVSTTSSSLDALTEASVQKAFKSVHGHREAFYVIVPVSLVGLALLKLVILRY